MPDTNSPEAIVDGTPAEPTAPAKPSVLVEIRQKWEAAGKKIPDAKVMAKLIDTYKQANAKASAAENAATAAKEAVYAASRAIAEATGAQPFKLSGVRHDVSARGDKVFFKAKHEEERKLLEF